jgi:hypothetical protein
MCTFAHGPFSTVRNQTAGNQNQGAATKKKCKDSSHTKLWFSTTIPWLMDGKLFKREVDVGCMVVTCAAQFGIYLESNPERIVFMLLPHNASST